MSMALGEEQELYVLAAKNHRLYFGITLILNVTLEKQMNKTQDYAVILIHVFNNTKNHRLLQ